MIGSAVESSAQPAFEYQDAGRSSAHMRLLNAINNAGAKSVKTAALIAGKVGIIVRHVIITPKRTIHHASHFRPSHSHSAQPSAQSMRMKQTTEMKKTVPYERPMNKGSAFKNLIILGDNGLNCENNANVNVGGKATAANAKMNILAKSFCWRCLALNQRLHQ